MIWPNLRIGAPMAIGAVAILWPLGTRSVAVGPPSGMSPGRISSIATMILSWALRRKARGLLIVRFHAVGPIGKTGPERSLAKDSKRVVVCCKWIFHRRAGSGGVAARYRRGDGAVLGQADRHSSGRRQQQAPHALQMRAQSVENLAALGEPQPRREQAVKIDVQQIEPGDIASVDRRLLIAQIALEAPRRLRSAFAPPPAAAISDSSARRTSKRSRTSSIEILATNDPRCGSIVTSRSIRQPVDRRGNGKPRHAEPLANLQLVDGAARLQQPPRESIP